MSWLTEELIALGHEVTLFASGDSRTSAKLEAMWPRALRLDGSVRDPNALHMMMLEQVYQRAGEFDFLHFHLDYYPFSLFSRQPTPFVTTLHGRLDLPEHQPVFDTFGNVPVVSISNSQRRPLPQAHWARTVLHGFAGGFVDAEASQAKLFGLPRAYRTGKGYRSRHPYRAKHCGIPLKVAAKVDRADQDYYDEQIEPLLQSGNVEFIGEINDTQKSDFLSGAIALLVPIDWPEPFGLVMIEAMACGTPVIAFNRGSVPEVIDDGISGFIVEDINGAIGAVDRLDHLSRAKIRRQFEQRFTARRMAQDRLNVYRNRPTNSRRICGLSATTRRRFNYAGRSGRVSCIINQSNIRPASAIRARPGKSRHAAETVGHVTGKGCAERCTNAGSCADNTLAEIESAGATGEIGNHQRHHHSENRGGDSVEKLYSDQQKWIAHQREQNTADRQGRKTDQQQRPASPNLCTVAEPGRQRRDDKLRHYDTGCNQKRGPIRRPHCHDAAHQRQHRVGFRGQVKQQQAAGKDEQRPVVHQFTGFNRRFDRRLLVVVRHVLVPGRSRLAKSCGAPAAPVWRSSTGTMKTARAESSNRMRP